MYNSDEHEMALLRGAHLTSVIRVTPPMMFANIGSGSCILLSFYPVIPTGLWVWFAALTLICALACWSWWHMRDKVLTTASVLRLKGSTVHAAALAGTWAVMIVIWFPQAGALQQMTIATLVTGMIGAGGFVLSPLPMASLVYVGLYTLASVLALLACLVLRTEAHYLVIALLLMLYSPMTLIGALLSWRKSSDLIKAQRRAAHLPAATLRQAVGR